ncbi:unnamed protein product [Caenorhabditis auriculariae]|uniref:7TM GPCR serpentine receptor class x (Srx) domain-containing protein n=1 Tax=Caenorhabditis auriculariae TaxID=2777116 RepID=A0A8S1HWT9_9PELO|nr:unnamed protein product [Caenorhabditis auriculariae]
MLEFRHYASIAMLLVSLFGTASNLLAILVIFKNSALKNSFGALCFSHYTCSFTFAPHNLQWEYSDTICGRTYSKFLDFVYGITVVGLMVIFDVITLTKLHRTNEIWHTKNVQSTSRKVSNVRRSAEVRLFAQACIQGCLLGFVIISFHFISRLSNAEYYFFLTTTLVWQLFHALDGSLFLGFVTFVVIFFHFKLAILKRKISLSVVKSSDNKAKNSPSVVKRDIHRLSTVSILSQVM